MKISLITFPLLALSSCSSLITTPLKVAGSAAGAAINVTGKAIGAGVSHLGKKDSGNKDS